MKKATIVALRALKLGDLLVCVPALRGLRRHWPHHQLILATTGWLAPIVELIGGVDELVSLTGLERIPISGRPEVAVNLHGAGPESNAILDELNPCRRIGHQGYGWSGPEWRDDLHERVRWCRLLSAHGIAADADDLYLDRTKVVTGQVGPVVLHPGAAYGSRRWPVDRFALVAKKIIDLGYQVVLTGTYKERDRALSVASQAGIRQDDVLAGRQSLSELAGLIANARLVVSADTGVAHLAYAYRTPSVVLFGPASPKQWGPPPSGPHVVLTNERARRGDAFTEDPDPALLGVQVADVLAAAYPMLA